MRRLVVFNSVSLDGYFADASGNMDFSRHDGDDAEWSEFVEGNAAGGGMLVFGRITYELMASFWPTPAAAEAMPVVAERMNAMPKLVFSRTLEKASWSYARLVKGDPVEAMRAMKGEPGEDMAILGSGSIVSRLAPHGLIDEYQIAVIPVVLGRGRTMFEGMKGRLDLKLLSARVFGNGNVYLRYGPASRDS
jgi:dihydrofolate reductase